MESRIICVVDKYISFLFGDKNEKDPKQKMYNKLLQLEGEELEDWVNTKLKNYITGEGDYLDYLIGENFEGNQRRIIFSTWYYWHNELEDELLSLDDIYADYEEEQLDVIKEKILTLTHGGVGDYWKMDLMEDYLEMYINTMTSVELKNYIKEITKKLE